jgi:hypothetical protein
MSAALQRARHSTSPEGHGNVAGFVSHTEAQRDLWELVLPSAHLRALDTQGAGVLSGLRVSAALNATSLTVEHGEALDPGGRLLALIASDGPVDLRVRLGPAPAGGSATAGLAAVGDSGAVVDTNDANGDPLTGDQYLILEWNETLLTVDSQPVYRATPWLRLEPASEDAASRWVVLAQVTLGDGAQRGQIVALAAGPRRSLSSLRDGLTLSRPTVTVNPLAVQDVAGSGVRVRPDGGFDLGIQPDPQGPWRPSLSVDGATGNVSLGAGLTLDVPGSLNAGALKLEGRPVPVIRAGRTDPANTPWQFYDVNSVTVVVDTSSAGFTETPIYFTSLGGNGSHFLVTGADAIYNPTPTSFQVYLRTPTIDPSTWSLSPQFVKDRLWHINWLGVLVH